MLAPKYREIQDGLAKVGFKTNLGLDGAGIIQLLNARAGGYYIGKFLEDDGRHTSSHPLDIDTGTSKHIIDGDIKIKNGSAIERFTEKGLKFADGTELEADIVVFSTG